jgi:signal transduction histidine kinase
MKAQGRSGWRQFSTRLLLGFCFLTVIGVFFSIRGTEGISWTSLRMALPRWYVWGALVPFIIGMDQRFAASRSLKRRLLLHLPAGLFWTGIFVVSLLLVTGFLAGQGVGLAGLSARVRTDFVNTFQWNIEIYWLIIGGWLAWDYYNESRNRELKATQLEILLAQSRLQMLQTQLQPHFLFNALNTISAFVERDPSGARRMIEHLGDLLRLSLENSTRQLTTLEEELKALNHFLAIQRVRFEDHLQVFVSAEPETLRATVPGLILQPLVENAIRHGVARQELSRVSISATRDNGYLRLRVLDNGPGLPAGWRLSADAGIGLSNTQQRLAQLYPATHQFTISESPTGGVLAEVVIPFNEE